MVSKADVDALVTQRINPQYRTLVSGGKVLLVEEKDGVLHVITEVGATKGDALRTLRAVADVLDYV